MSCSARRSAAFQLSMATPVQATPDDDVVEQALVVDLDDLGGAVT